MNDEREEQLIANLHASAQMAALTRDFCRHPIFHELQKWIDQKVSNAHKEWVTCHDKNKRDELWFKVQPYQELQDVLKKFIIAGDTAEANLKQLDESQDDL